ncbi:MAG TPA: undecaprenyl-diphosphate phosphatase [Candidatus Sulfotelmatobacter sp.]|nr:undecaprenyl-diphosphate phosphatase [Candidatus Sulfotelmatobacter sp.]
MSTLQAILYAVLQGVTELFPVSSLGHAVVLPRLLGWSVDQHSPQFLPFLVVLHLGTATALLIYFWRDWLMLLVALIGGGPAEERAGTRRLFVLIVVGTLPAVVIGYAFRKFFGDLFATPAVAAAFLIVNGFVLFAGERLRRRGQSGRLDALTWKGALAIGFWQCTALLPGISRSGATMVGGLLAGLHHEQAARFSFLLATPIIAGAAVLEVPKLLHHSEGASLSELAVLAGVVAGVTAFASIAFLMRYFRKHDFEALDPFAWYCWIAGAAALALFVFVF